MIERLSCCPDLTAEEFLSLRLVARNVPAVMIPSTHRHRLAELGLIRSFKGKLQMTPNGRMVAFG